MKCPECNSKQVVKRGMRKRSFGSIQIYQCKECQRRFTNESLEHKTYSARIIYNAINYYNIGYSFVETSKLVNKKFKVKTSKSTIHTWLEEFHSLCPISTIREDFLGSEEYENVLFSKRFEHENLDYEFMYHKYKLDVLVKKQFPNLFKYVTGFEKGCPDVFFEVGERCSKPQFEVQVKTKKRTNLACKMAGFAASAARQNRERHKMVENFILINDKATIACEIPVWYWDKKIDSGVTGHIDLLQVRNDLVYILDYKPDASKDKKAAQQLYHYAVALSFRTRVSLKNIRCAWFDKDSYYEYSPTNAKVTLISKFLKKA